jgi:bifunctional DNase/RNase
VLTPPVRLRIVPAGDDRERRAMDVELRVIGLMVDPITNMPMVVLRDPRSDSKLPIWVGAFEALAIANELEKVRSPRPMTHDLIRNVLDALGARMSKLVITDVSDNIFYATMHLEGAAEAIEIDCRPSDGIALALRYEAPIFATEVAIEKAQHIDLTAGHRDSEKIRLWIESLGKSQPGKYEH